MYTRDFLKQLVGDIDPNNQKITDEQYDIIMKSEKNFYRAASLCCQIMAANYVKKKSVNLRGISVQNQQVYKQYMDLAKLYDNKVELGQGYLDEEGKGVSPFASPYASGVETGEVEKTKEDHNIVQSVFPRPDEGVM